MSEDKKHIEDVFREALQNHEATVSPKVWSGVEAGIGNVASSTIASSTILGKAAAVIGFSALIIGATISEINHLPNQQKTTSEEEISNHQEELQKEQKDRIENITFTEELPEATTASPEPNQEPAGLSNTPTTQLAHEESSETSSTSVKADAQIEIDYSKPVAQQSVSKAAENKQMAETKQAQTNSNVSSEQQSASHSAEDKAEEKEHCNVFIGSKKSLYLTPNGDGSNDVFELEISNTSQFSIRISSRNGALVYESNDPNFAWNGTDMMGRIVPEGVYYYVIQAVDNNGILYSGQEAKSHITIVRN